MPRRTHFLAVLTAAAVAWTVAPAGAQEAQPPAEPSPPAESSPPAEAAPTTGREIEEIVVTARRKVENVQEVPLSVTALSGDELKLSSVQDLQDIEQAAPGIQIRLFGARTSTAAITMRGQSSGSDVATVDGAVGVYINEVYIGKEKGLNQQLFDIERVEVLRGPQGTYFGRNTTGGALLVTTHQPEEEFGGYLTGHYGQFARYGIEGAVNVPITETLQSRVAFNLIRRNGYNRRCVGSPGFGRASLANFPTLIGAPLPNPAEVDGTNCPENDYQDLDDENANAWRLSLLWSPSDDFRTSFVHDGFVANSNGTASFLTRVQQADPSAYPSVTLPQLMPFIPFFQGIPALAALGNPIALAAAACQGQFSPGAPLTLIPGGPGVVTNSTVGLADCLHEGRLSRGGAMTRDLEESQRQSASEAKQFGRIRNYGLSLNSEADFDAFIAKLILGYRYVNVKESFDLDGTSEEVLFTNQFFDQRQVSVELLFSGSTWEDRVDWTTGLYMFREWGDDGSESPALTILGTPINIFDAEFTHESYSMFGQLDYEFAPDWTVTGGFRWTWDERDMVAKHRNENFLLGTQGCAITDNAGVPRETPGNPLPCRQDLHKGFDAPTWEAKLSWQASDTNLLYLAHRRGYRSGGFNLRAQNDFQFQPFDEETVTDIELGLKSEFELASVPIRANVAAYYSWYDDAQRSVIIISPTGNLQTVILNAAEATIPGAEIELFANPFDSLELRFNTTIAVARYDEYEETYDSSPAPGIQPAVFDRSDQHFGQPDYAIGASARWTLPIDQMFGRSSGAIALQLDWNWYDDTLTAGAATPALTPTGSVRTFDDVVQQSYSIFNLRMDWSGFLDTPFDLSFFVKNLLDREYAVGTVGFQNTFGYDVDNLGPSRLWAGTITYRF